MKRWIVPAALVAGVAVAVAVVARVVPDPAARWPSTVVIPPDGDEPDPVGQPPGAWRIVFGDEFAGDALDRSRWDDRSSAEADEGRGNPGNQQLEWNQADNCRVGGGELVMTARREPHTSPAGQAYEWTSCLITSTPSFGFHHLVRRRHPGLPHHGDVGRPHEPDLKPGRVRRAPTVPFHTDRGEAGGPHPRLDESRATLLTENAV